MHLKVSKVQNSSILFRDSSRYKNSFQVGFSSRKDSMISYSGKGSGFIRAVLQKCQMRGQMLYVVCQGKVVDYYKYFFCKNIFQKLLFCYTNTKSQKIVKF